nr:TraR/DksA C4-type zinc finger protein [Streptomyces sp. WMMB 322]
MRGGPVADRERSELPGPDERKALTVRLARQARELRAEIAACEASGAHLHDDCELDVADAAAARGSEDRLHTQVEQARQQLVRTERALARLADGSFGVCAHCSHPVGKERLAAIPTAELCVACKSHSEEGGRPEG